MAPRLGDEKNRFLSLLPQDGTAIGNMSLRDQLGWNEGNYLQIRDQLLDQDLICLGKGRGGSVRLVAGDKGALLRLVPKDGLSVSNKRLIESVGWDEDRYWKVRERLLEEGVLQVGRGGGGGTISRASLNQAPDASADELTEPELSPRAETRAFLSHVPEDGSTISNAKMMEHLGWDEERYQAVKARLLDKEVIAVAGGRGGTVYRVINEVAEPELSPRAETRAFLSHVPEDGSTISNAKVMEHLGWDEERYQAVKARLLDKEVIAVAGGRGGTVYRVINEVAEPELSPRAETRAFLSHVPEDGSTISNAKMMEHLGWDEERYQAVKARLLDKEVIAVAGGRGGTVYRVINEVAEPELSPRAETRAFLSHVPEDGSTISNAKMMEHLGWDEERYQAVKARLLDKEVIAVASGRGGTVYRVINEVTEPELSPRAETRAFLSHVPEDGSTISNAKMMEHLGWDEERYQAVKARLLDKEVIAVAGGRGGTVYRVINEVAEPELSPRAETRAFLSHVPEDGSTISNAKMMEHLGWDEERYQAVKARLLDKEVIAVAGGRGGTVYRVLKNPSAKKPDPRAEEPRTPQPGPAGVPRHATSPARYQTSPAREESAGATKYEPLEVFIAYAHQDEELRKELGKSLKILERKGHIQSWHDQKIVPGDNWQKEIDKQLSRANIILLLISRDFIASEYCHNVELEKAMRRHEAGEARVIPIILRRCPWEDSPFAELKALPEDGKPVKGNDWHTEDEAFFSIHKGIVQAINELRGASRGP